MNTYVKKPETIQAIPFTREYLKEIRIRYPHLLIENPRHPEGMMVGKIQRSKEEGFQTVLKEGDYLVIEAGDRDYVMKKEAFEQLYQEAEEHRSPAKLTPDELSALVYVISKQANIHHEEALTHALRREVAEMNMELNLAKMYQQIVKKAYDWLEEELR